MDPVASSKINWLEDVKKYSFSEVSKLFGVLIEKDNKTLRVFEFSKRSFCWVSRGSFYSISFLNDHILKCQCLNSPFKYLLIDLLRGVKITSSCREIFFNSEYIAEESREKIVVRSIQTIEKVFKSFNNSDNLIMRCLSGSQMICHTKDKSILGYSDWLYVLDQEGSRPLIYLRCHIVFHRYYTSLVAKSRCGQSDVYTDLEKLKKITELKNHFKDYPYVFGSAENFFGICHHMESSHEVKQLTTPYFLSSEGDRLLMMSDCGNYEYEKGYFRRSTQTETYITTAHGSTSDYVLIGERDSRYVYDIEQGKIVQSFKTVD